jgi:putative ABC transport system permease protein
MAVISPEAYKAQFGHDNEVNCFYVRCNGIREQEVRDRLSGLSQYISIENSDSYKAMAETSKELCTILAVIMVVLSLLMSLMIMINLTNILVEHRMKELLIMRVNGFYFRQVIGYLLRESAFVTGLGLIIGIIVGVPFSTALVRGFEGRSAMYIRTPYVWVWAVSILFNLLFAVVIDSIAFRKVKKQPLTNIMFYS